MRRACGAIAIAMPARRSTRQACCRMARRSRVRTTCAQALLRRPEQFVQTFTEGLLTYATGRKLEHYDMPTVRRIVHGAAASDYRFSTHRAGGRSKRAVQDAPRAATGAQRRDAVNESRRASRRRPTMQVPGRRRNVSVQEARLTSRGVEGCGRHDRAAAPRCDEPRGHRVGADAGRRDAEAVRLHRLPARRDHGQVVAGADRRRASRCRRSCSRSSRSASI